MRTLQSAHVGWFMPWSNYVVMFLGKTHYYYHASLHPGTWMIKNSQISIFRWRAAVLHVASFERNWEKLRQLWATARKPQPFIIPERITFIGFFSYSPIILLSPSVWFKCFFPFIISQNSCGTTPCMNGGTCQSGFLPHGYRCLCAAGFSGLKCERGKKFEENGITPSEIQVILFSP